MTNMRACSSGPRRRPRGRPGPRSAARDRNAPGARQRSRADSAERDRLGSGGRTPARADAEIDALDRAREAVSASSTTRSRAEGRSATTEASSGAGARWTRARGPRGDGGCRAKAARISRLEAPASRCSRAGWCGDRRGLKQLDANGDVQPGLARYTDEARRRGRHRRGRRAEGARPARAQSGEPAVAPANPGHRIPGAAEPRLRR